MLNKHAKRRGRRFRYILMTKLLGGGGMRLSAEEWSQYVVLLTAMPPSQHTSQTLCFVVASKR